MLLVVGWFRCDIRETSTSLLRSLSLTIILRLGAFVCVSAFWGFSRAKNSEASPFRSFDV